MTNQQAGAALGRIFWLLLLALAGPSSGLAQSPAEKPPADFAGGQYIDSKGCVFARDGAAWVARLGSDDQPVCGYPPSFSARRLDATTETALAPAQPVEPPRIEEALMATLAEGLQDGELVDDRLPQQKRLDLARPKPTEGPLADLGTLVAVAPRAKASITGGLLPDNRLCRLLGGKAGTQSAPALGADPTGGFCPGLPQLAINSVPKVDEAVPMPVSTISATSSGPAAAVVAATVPAAARERPGNGGQAHRSSKTGNPAKPATHERTATDKAVVAIRPETIPSTARYIVIGRFDSSEAAAQVSRRISAMGHPVARGRSKAASDKATFVVAGPFADRGAIVAALNDLRSEGFRAAVAR